MGAVRQGGSSLLGTDLPLVQAPMAGVQGSALAIAVSNAGGLGSLPAAMLTPDGLRDEIATVTAHTSGPYNINFFCHVPAPTDAGREARWLALLAPYYREFGVDAATVQQGPGRTPFDHDAADVVAQFKPPVVSFHFGLPSKELLDRISVWRPTIVSSATTVDEARWLEAHGVDAIVAQGLEAGGHRGMFLSHDPATQVGTFTLVRQIVRAVRVPVIAAGGVADTEGIAAALALGATAVQVGTAYLLCPEATTSRVHRDALSSPAVNETTLTNIFSGRLARGIVNRLVRELGAINSLAPGFPRAAAAVGPLRARAEARGSGDFSPLWAGQNAARCKNIPAADVTRELAGHLGVAAGPPGAHRDR
jgi:nitronate monooxygenase